MKSILPVVFLMVLVLSGLGTTESQAEDKTLFGRLESLGLTLHRSYQGPDAMQPAEFGYVKARETDPEFLTNFCLTYSPARNPFEFLGAYNQPALSVEGRLSSADGDTGDAWAIRAGLESDWVTRGGLALYLASNAALEADRKFHTEYLLGELLTTPTFRPMAMGKAQPAAELRPDGTVDPDRLPHLQVMWRPFLEFAAGGRIKGRPADVDADQDDDTLLRFRLRLTATAYFNFLSRWLGLEESYLYGDAQGDLLPREDTDYFHSDTGVVLKFNSNLSATCAYTQGKLAPLYAKEERLAIMLGVEF
jgi:hypothetical protein